MKVLNLQCSGGHAFEGWFSSEGDFQGQIARALVACPLCADTQVVKLPTAPRLRLTRASGPKAAADEVPSPSSGSAASLPASSLHAAWLQLARQLMAQTEDVGDHFPEEARRIHHGDAEARGIRGRATPEQTKELLEEGISVLPLPLPEVLKNTLH